MIIDKDTFFQIVEKFEYIPFEQTLAWENYKDESNFVRGCKVPWKTSFILWMINQLQIYVAGGEL